MLSIWFQRRWVEPILAGEKRDTIRAKRGHYQPGEIIQAQVGPKPPFCLLRIEAIERVSAHDLSPDRASRLASLYDAGIEWYWRLVFQVVPRLAPAE